MTSELRWKEAENLGEGLPPIIEVPASPHGSKILSSRQHVYAGIPFLLMLMRLPSSLTLSPKAGLDLPL